jgi:predicted Zn finger-like uncharacterized protein
MYAQCPDCLTVFSLDAAILAQASGLVLCGHCETAFDALSNLADQLPPEPFRLLPARTASGEAPRLELAVYRPRDDVPAAVIADTGGPDEDFTQLTFSPPFARAQGSSRQIQGTPRERRWPWVLTCTALLLLLATQLAWAKREALITDPSTGAWLRGACASLGCRVPLVQDVRQLHLVARDVQAHPSVPGALMISATVHNAAAFAQPYPVVTLTLSDASGKRVAMRRLRPSEYLGDDAIQQAGLPPGANTALLFEVEDPGRKAVAFEFSFE